MANKYITLLVYLIEAGDSMPKVILQWLKGETVDPAILQPEYGRMFAKNDYLVEINVN